MDMLLRNRDEVEPVTFSDATGVEMRPLITDKQGAPHFAMRVFDLAPAGHTPHHTHAWEHVVYIVRGTGTVLGREGERSLRPGDAVLLVPNETHQFRAGAAGMQMICCVPNQ
ncbi:MAG: cupin domain-containing protein [Candidatus Binatia bacterium]